MDSYFLILMQLIAHLRLSHIVILDIDGVAEISNLTCILKMIRHRHLRRDGRLALHALYDFPLGLLVAAHAVEGLGDRRIHALVAHLLQRTLLRPRRILKRVLLGPKLLLLNEFIAIVYQTRDHVVILVSVVVLVYGCRRTVDMLCIWYHVVQG